MEIITVVVTFNRKKLLIECLDAILKQRQVIKRIIVIDNASTDGTDELFIDGNRFDNALIFYKKMGANIGGAGGFYEGIKLAYSQNCDWIWIMDDDTIPDIDSLEMLCKSISKVHGNISFLASCVYGPNGEVMNVPTISLKETVNGYSDWYRYLSDSLVGISSATFVSLLINKKAVAEVGFPLQDYFIWGDDSEYTLRLTNYYGDAYLCGKSKVLHKRFNAKKLDIKYETDINRINLYYYYFRNTLINISAYYNKFELAKTTIAMLIEIIKILFQNNIRYKIKKAQVILRGVIGFYFCKYDKESFNFRLVANKCHDLKKSHSRI